MNKAQTAASKFNLVKSSHYWHQNELSNDDLIVEIQALAVKSFQDGDDELFLFADGSCINRTGDEYYINDNVDLLDIDYLSMIGYL